MTVRYMTVMRVIRGSLILSLLFGDLT
jgi:hypothetical protein